MNISHLYNNTVRTARATETVDSGGSPVSAYAILLNPLVCRVQENTGFEPVEGARKFSKYSYVLYCNFNTNILMDDIVTYDDDNYNVVDVKKEGNSNTYLKVTLELTDTEVPCVPQEGTLWNQVSTYPGTPEFTGVIDKLLVYSVDGLLYGTASGTGELLQWNEEDEWIVVATRYSTEKWVNDLIEYQGELYASGQNTGGKGLLLKWDGSSAWELMAERTLLASDFLNKLVVFEDEIYGGTTRQSELWKWDGASTWDLIVPDPTPTGSRGIESLIVYDNGSGETIYAGTDTTALMQWDGASDWNIVANIDSTDSFHIFAMLVFEGKLYLSTGDEGNLLIWNDVDGVTKVAGALNDQTQLFSILEYEGEIYCGSYPDAQLLKWNGTDKWIVVASNLPIPGTGILSFASLVEHNCRIFGSIGSTSNDFDMYRWDKS